MTCAAADFSAWLLSSSFEAQEHARALMILQQFGMAHLAAVRPEDLPYGHRKLAELARAIAEEPVVMRQAQYELALLPRQ